MYVKNDTLPCSLSLLILIRITRSSFPRVFYKEVQVLRIYPPRCLSFLLRQVVLQQKLSSSMKLSHAASVDYLRA